jgi:hypothetical protein
VAIVVAFVTQNHDFGNCDEQLFGRYSGTSTVQAVKDVMYAVDVLPDELANAGVIGNCFVAVVLSFVACRWAFDGAVIHKWSGSVGDFGLEDKCDIVVEDSYCISPPLRKAGETYGSDRGLDCSEIARYDVECPVVVAYEEVEHGIAGASCHTLYELVSKGRDAGVSDSDGVEGLEVMDDAEHSTLLLHAEPSRVVGGIGAFVNACCKLVFEHLDNIVEDAQGDRDVLVCPRDVFYNGDLNQCKVVITEAAFLSLCPGKAKFIETQHVVEQLQLFRPEKVVAVEL